MSEFFSENLHVQQCNMVIHIYIQLIDTLVVANLQISNQFKAINHALTLLHLGQPKLNRVLAVLSAIRLMMPF